MENELTHIGILISRYGLVVVLIWIGGMKFTKVEAEGIKPLVENSPFMGWLYNVMSVTAVSKMIGIIELITGILIALRPVAPTLSGVGSLMAIVTFLITMTYLFTTPGWEENLGFPALSVSPGQFILKDIVLLGVALWTAGEAFAAGGVF